MGDDQPFGEEFVPITPINFFQIGADCCYIAKKNTELFSLNKDNFKKYLLPDLSDLCSEESFADVAMVWNEGGLEFYFSIKRPFRTALYPEIEKGDSVEVFIDTRDVKNAGFNHRFCHHFFFLAEAIEGRIAGEMTRFRTEDIHVLCDPSELKVKSLLQNSRYVLQSFIPSECLFGYDPDQFDRLGFSYRINQSEGFSQHFTVVSDDYPIEQQPSLWGSLRLVKS